VFAFWKAALNGGELRVSRNGTSKQLGKQNATNSGGGNATEMTAELKRGESSCDRVIYKNPGNRWGWEMHPILRLVEGVGAKVAEL